jgi:predicted ATPase
MTMLTRLRIKNLKGLRDTGDMAIRPLTFLIGPNSAGKSTAIEALLMIRQTVDSRDQKNPLLIDGPYVKLNSYRDLIYGHHTENQLSIELGLLPWHEFESDLFEGKFEDLEVLLSVSFGYDKKRSRIHPTSVILETHLRGDSAPIESGSFRVKSQMIRTSNGKYTRSLEITSEKQFVPYLWEVPDIEWNDHPSKFYLFPIEVLHDTIDRPPTGDMWFHEFAHVIEDIFEDTFYLGPLRAEPRRVYVTSGETPQDVGLRGERSVDVLKSAGGDADLAPRLFEKVSHWLKKFDIAVEVNLRQLTEGYFFVEITNPFTKVPVNLADTGFGGSQVLPVIVQGFYQDPNSVLLLEQPEIHLHPRSQATLGDLFIDIANDNKRLIVETHSEHMISRIQRRIAEGTVKREDVAIHYFEPNEDGTRVFEIKLNEDGQFIDDGLPENFFAEGYIESMEHLKAIASK